MSEQELIPAGTGSPEAPGKEQTNEQPGQTETAGPSGIFEKIRASVQPTLDKYGIQFKKGRGRPRKDGQPKISDVPLNAPETALPASVAPVAAVVPAPGAPAFDSALVRRCVSAVGKAASGILDKKLYSQAMAASGDSNFAQKLVRETAITKEELDSFGELAEICLKKYGVGTEYAPEIGLGAVLLGIGARYSMAFGTLNAELAKQKQAGKPVVVQMPQN